MPPPSLVPSFHINHGQITKKYNTVGTDPKVNRKIVERIEIDTTNTPIYDRALFWLGTDTSIKSCRVKLALSLIDLAI
jgi:hypothetical protein